MPDYDILRLPRPAARSRGTTSSPRTPSSSRRRRTGARRRRPTTSRSGAESKPSLSRTSRATSTTASSSPSLARQGRLDRQGTPAAAGASVRRRRSERGRPSAVTGGGAVGGYAVHRHAAAPRFRCRRRAGFPGPRRPLPLPGTGLLRAAPSLNLASPRVLGRSCASRRVLLGDLRVHGVKRGASPGAQR